MNNYIITAKFGAEQADGLIKAVTEQYLVRECISFGEAEERIAKHLAGYDNVDITAVKRTNINEVVLPRIPSGDENEKWYKAKITVTTLDEKTAKERTQTRIMLVFANDLGDARKSVIDHMSDSVCDYDITTIDETKIADVFNISK